jgi:hypothetical protein
MAAMVMEKLESRLSLARQNPLNLVARVVVINHLLVSSTWYLLIISVGTERELKAMQDKILQFIRAGQKKNACHRVDKRTICRLKHAGGLGLLEVPTQAASLSGKVLLWLVHKDNPTNVLRNLLQHYIKERSMEAWGVSNYT